VDGPTKCFARTGRRLRRLTNGTDDLLLATARGMAIRFNEDDVRVMGRPAAGVKGIELADDDEVVGVVVIPMKPDADGDPMSAEPDTTLLTISENGYGKRTPVDEYRVQPETGKARSQSRGGKGRADIKTSERNGRSVAALGVIDSDDVVIISKGGQLVRVPGSSISQIGRGTQGVRIVSLNDGDAVIASAVVRDTQPPKDAAGLAPDSSGTPGNPGGPTSELAAEEGDAGPIENQ
jgi:DNA gyrase subunit A